jgi:hypothetical protein
MTYEVPEPTVYDIVELQEAFAARDRLVERAKANAKRLNARQQLSTRRPHRS